MVGGKDVHVNLNGDPLGWLIMVLIIFGCLGVGPCASSCNPEKTPIRFEITQPREKVKI